MLCAEDIQKFEQDGALLLPTKLPEKLIRAASGWQDELHHRKGQMTGVLQYVEGQAFADICQHPMLEQAAQRIIGCSEVALAGTASLRTEPHTTEKWCYQPEALHVDIQYTRHEWMDLPRQIIVTFVVFLDDVEEECGPTVYFPGSQLMIADHLGDAAAFKEQPVALSELPPLSADPQVLCAKAGEVAAFTTACIHGASENATAKPRKVLFVLFSPKGMPLLFNANFIELRHRYLYELNPLFRPERRYLLPSSATPDMDG